MKTPGLTMVRPQPPTVSIPAGGQKPPAIRFGAQLAPPASQGAQEQSRGGLEQFGEKISNFLENLQQKLADLLKKVLDSVMEKVNGFVENLSKRFSPEETPSANASGGQPQTPQQGEG